MAITLTLFLLYHCSMIAEGTTTNEKIKKSDINHALKMEIKSIDQKMTVLEEDSDQKKAYEDQKKDLYKEFNKIENCFMKGFWANLKEIISL